MKNYTAFIVIIFSSLFSYGQVQYSFPLGTVFEDVPGDNFLIAYKENSRTFIAEINLLGATVWKDSTGFNGLNDSYAPGDIVKMNGTDKYVLSMGKSDSIYSGTIDTVTYQFSTFSRINQSFSSFVIDTFNAADITHWIDLISINDSSILILNKTSINPSTIETFKIDSTPTITSVAPSDSISLLMDEYSFYPNGNGLFLLKNYENIFYLNEHDSSISLVNEFIYQIPSTYTFDRDFIYEFISSDSVLIFMQSYSSGSPVVNWNLAWTDNTLSPTLNASFLSPTDSNQLNYRTQSAIYSGGLIYIYAYTEDPSGGAPIYTQKIFVYDVNFDFVCSISVNVLFPSTLMELNGKPYLKYNYNQDRIDFYPIENCTEIIGIENTEEKDSFVIFPNPTSQNISLRNENNLELSITLYDSFGRKISHLNSLENLININFESFSNGIYFIHINSQDITTIKKIIKE